MIAVIMIEYENGEKEYCVTDETWQVRDSGIIQDCMYMGETFDARRENDCKDKWEFCTEVKKPLGKLKYDFSEPISITKKLTPSFIKKIGDKQFVFGFDEYLTGWIELTLDCKKDTEVSIQYTEKTDESGIPYLHHSITENGRLQKDFFISAGEKVTYRPMFSYKGFRYVLIEGLEEMKITDVVGCMMHNDVKSVMEFECSDDLLNWIHNATRRTILCNFHGLSTDTPVFEKQGWGGDAAAIAPSAFYNFNIHRFYRKWAYDFLESQTDEGEISVIVPTPGWGVTGKTPWKAVCGPTPTVDVCWPEIVYRLYWCYEDIDALKENYDGLKKYAAYINKYANNGLCDKGIGDWLPPTGDRMVEWAEPPEGPQVVESAYHIRIFERMEQIATILEKEEDAKYFKEERKRLIDLFNKTYYDEQKGYYHKEGYYDFRQAGNVLAIAFGIATDEIKKNVMKNLLNDLVKRDWHFCMGMYTSMYLPIVLSEEGYHEDAIKVVTAKGYPGFDFMRQTGSTTIFEAWECEVCRSSCHYAFGATDNWIISYLGGVKQLAPGYSKVKIEPNLPESIEYYNYSFDTIRGVIDVKCYRENGKLVTEINAPKTIEIVK